MRILRSLDADLLVVVENWFLSRLMYQHARKSGFVASHFSRHVVLDSVPDLIQRRLYHCSQRFRGVALRLLLLKQSLRNKRLLAKHRRETPFQESSAGKDPDVLLVTWAEPGTFRAGTAKDTDKYYGDLPKRLSSHGYKGYIIQPFPVPLEKVLAQSRSALDFILYLDECWDPKDIIRTLWVTLFRPCRVRSRFLFDEVDLTELLEDEIREEIAKGGAVFGSAKLLRGSLLEGSQHTAENGCFPL